MKSALTLLTLVLLLTACGGGGGGLVTPAGPGESPGMSQPPSQETGGAAWEWVRLGSDTFGKSSEPDKPNETT